MSKPSLAAALVLVFFGAANVSAQTFVNPQLVTVHGYSGPQQDPVISSDGRYLFFDSHNDAGNPVYTYFALRVNHRTFQVQGLVGGINTPGQMTLRGNYDLAGNFYFVSMAWRTACGMLAKGKWANGAVTGIAPVSGICAPPPPPGSWAMNFDVQITPDGNTLYYSESVLNSSGQPSSSRLNIATKNPDGSFTKNPNSDAVLANVNAMHPAVYNGSPTPDGLSLFFTPSIPATRAGIYKATRATAADVFGTPVWLSASSGGLVNEMGSISPDGKYLYFHRVTGPSTSRIYVMTKQ